MQKQNSSYDVYHSHYVDAGIVAMKTTDKFGKRFFHTAHSLGAWKRHQMGGNPDEMENTYNFNERISWENELILEAVGIITTNPEEMKIYEDLYDSVPFNTIMCPPGVDTVRYYPSEQTEDVGLPKPYIYCVSRIDANKGLDSILHAFAIAKNKAPDLHLVIGGGSKTPGPVEQGVLDNLHQIVKEKKLENKVVFTGYIPDNKMAGYYRNALAFVLPSRFEPFGMTTQEAMACGTPCIVTSLGGLKHFLTDSENALLVDPSQYAKLAEAILKIYNDKTFALKIGQGGLRIVQEHFTWDAIVRKHLEFYSKTLA
jgi:mannosylfructose-phosphate synthase